LDWKPDTITKRLIELKKTVGIDIRFHDLRHYFASTAAILGIPDIYTADLGGWQRDGRTMKAVYQNNIKSVTDYYSDKVATYRPKVVSLWSKRRIYDIITDNRKLYPRWPSGHYPLYGR
jgi:integrase